MNEVAQIESMDPMFETSVAYRFNVSPLVPRLPDFGDGDALGLMDHNSLMPPFSQITPHCVNNHTFDYISTPRDLSANQYNAQ